MNKSNPSLEHNERSHSSLPDPLDLKSIEPGASQITYQHQTYQHKTIADADKTLNCILDVIAEGTWDWDGKTGSVVRSTAWFEMLGYEVGTFQQNVYTWENVIHKEDYDKVMQSFEKIITHQTDSYCIDYRCRKSDGSYLWITDRSKAVEYNPDGSVARIIGAHQDIHQQKKAQLSLFKQNQQLELGNTTLEKLISIKTEQLEAKNKQLEEKILEIERLANTDSLTNIANRKKFEEALNSEISRANRYEHALSFVIFDIDHFKLINDSFGHKIGDQVLQNMASVVVNNIRDIDVFARWGGEEFVLILPCITIEAALNFSERLRQLISQTELSKGVYITCSFGVSEYHNTDTVEDLFHRADQALYRVKNNGRNSVQCEKINADPISTSNCTTNQL
ncbi:diguanylate cyclase [Vibrio sp. 2-Bac 85]